MLDTEREIQIGSRAIHATHHGADGKRFVVIAPPLFEENARLRKVLVNLSRYLAGDGYDVVRFDYYGTGYSPGRYTDVTLEHARTDLHDAVDFCRRAGGTEVSLIGARFGGYLVLESLENSNWHRVVAWEPVMDPAAYVKEVLRSEVASQMLIYGKVRYDRERLVEMLNEDGETYVEGYRISSELYNQFSAAAALDVGALESQSGRFALVYWQSRRDHKRWSTRGFPSHWTDGIRLAYNHIRHLDPQPIALFHETLEELRQGG